MKTFVSYGCLLLISVSTLAQPFDPVNRNASPEAKHLLKYLYSINGRQLLSGQHNYNESMHRYDDSVYAITGKYPAVWGTDFIWNWKTDNGQAIVDECIRRNKQGFIITLMWHQGRPTDDAPFGWKESIQGKLTDEQWKALTTEGTTLHKRWLAQVDVVAGYLGQLKTAHVPVLWRPYHEMNGTWFWWGNKKGKDGIARLWQMMYDRYVNHFHLDNLLWVWGANGPRDIPGDEAYAYKNFYPGHQFVDILGTDVYHMDYEQRDYDELLGLAGGRLIALTECGELPSPAILDAQPKWSWFLVWSDWIYSHNTPQQVRAVYDRAQTVTHDEVGVNDRAQTLTHDGGSAVSAQMHLNSREYLEYEGVNVMLAHDFYPEGHQGGVGVIQHGQRVATNGDIRLEPTPGQWQPIPKVGKRMVDTSTGSVSVHMQYPDETKDRKGFNPVIYPDLHFGYTIRVVPAGVGFKIIVDLDSALPAAWIGKVGFNFELYPGVLFGRSYYMDSSSGIFPQQPNGPHYKDADGEWQIKPMATGRRLVVAPESDNQRMSIECLKGDALQLMDGRGKHNNGWFVVRSLVAAGAVKSAIEWLVTPYAIKGWQASPTVQVSQVGYHPLQQKIAVVELDARDKRRPEISLVRIGEQGASETVLRTAPREWGDFLRYHYLQFDFTAIRRPGMYVVRYGDIQTNPFQIGDNIYARNVWQPTLEYFLPAQMCHMRVNDKYRIWHGYCHMDDGRMAPVDSNHFDGYIQGHSTLTSYRSGETVPGLNIGAWHDAGDFDLRVESQAETVYGLTLAYEAFSVDYDNTSIDQGHHVVEIQQPDGKPDVLQQIEHGLLSIVGGYKSMGRFYRGIIEPTLRQYTTLGDAANITDNRFYDGSGVADDRWVFTEENPGRALEVAAALAAAYRVMKGYNDTLANDCLRIAKQVWVGAKEKYAGQRIELAAELYLSTKDQQYANFLTGHRDEIARSADRHGWVLGRVLPLLKDSAFTSAVTGAMKTLRDTIVARGKRTPYGVPYEPNIWGAGWDIQHFGAKQYFLHQGFPGIFSEEYMLAALNFILGCHPGENTASFASGVGAHSMIPAYGSNRADWSYIPGGIASGTALIRPDFPELLSFPYLWQQGEYVLGGGTTDYLLLVLAADQILNKK